MRQKTLAQGCRLG